MKKMNFMKGLAAGLLSVIAMTAGAQTDTTRTDTTRTDTTMQRNDSTQMQSSYPKQDYTIVDLSTNQPVDIFYDTVKYLTINRATNEPVDFYVINNTDTVHGPTGLVVNGMLLKEGDGHYRLNDAQVKVDGDEMKIKTTDGRKIKWENGKMKVKEWGEKRKYKTDKQKMKNQWTTVKWKDGEWKVENS